MSLKLPDNFKWKVTNRNIGQGGQSTIREVENAHAPDGKKYALKALKQDASEQGYQRFVREIYAVRSINHPNVIKVVDHSAIGDDFHYYVMEYIEGAVSLKKLLGTDYNPFEGSAIKSIGLFSQLVGAISAINLKGIVHRDLSPGNVLILPDRTAKIIDFGICQIVGHATITLVDEGVGTQNYMAPECESGSETDVDYRADLYSAGKLLWSAVTNLKAFAREAPAFTSHSLNSIYPRSPETWHLHHIFEKTIRHKPEDRFASPIRALDTARRLAYVISNGYPPLELLANQCSICGYGELHFSKPYGSVLHPFRNPLPDGVSTAQCDYCGYWQAIENGKISDALEKRRGLE